MSELANRRHQTNARFDELKKFLSDAETHAAGKACVYATGSFGRGEASKHSDLDLFIVGKSASSTDDRSALKKLDEICIKADLIKATRQLKIVDFSGDGRYLTHHSVRDFTKTLGTADDDANNTFTARLLLLLESRPLVGPAVYGEIIEDVIAAYWRDYENHRSEFIPAFLTNDILRLWRTFCVNYEARTERVPEAEKAKGKLKNYKLKHSRLLTCYSGILHLLAVYGRSGTVSPQHAMTMIQMTPTKRIEWLLKQKDLAKSHDKIRRLLVQYDKFLATTNTPETDLIERFSDKSQSNSLMKDAREFGDTVFDILNSMGNRGLFHRLLVV